MDEDELEMLSEARARLANTQVSFKVWIIFSFFFYNNTHFNYTIVISQDRNNKYLMNQN